MKFYLTLCAFLLSTFSFAQKSTLYGSVQDSASHSIPFTSIALSNPTDTSLVQFAISKEDGSFKFTNIDHGSYLLMLACFGYEVEYLNITLPHDSSLKVIMKATKLTIKEVTILANKMPIMLNGDTIVYNSSSFKTQSNATVEDLIKKMPGIQVNADGSVSAEGQTITKILVNGKEFFGGNVEAATKNLDASMVDKVEVIDKKTDDDEFTGDESSDREKVINLVLKKEHHTGYFGTVKAGYGTDKYHNVHGNMNFFKDEIQLSIIGGINNIDQQLYGWRDMNTLQSFEITPFNQGDFRYMWTGGVSSYKGVGTNLHIEPAKNLKADIAYIITKENSIKNTLNNSAVYLSNSSLYSRSVDTSNGVSNSHQINAKLEFEPDSLNRFVFRNQFTANTSLANSFNRTTNFYSIEDLLNSGVNKDLTENGNSSYATKLHWTRKRKKQSEDYFLGSIYFGGNELYNKFDSYYKTDTTLLPFPSLEAPLLNQELHTKSSTIATTTAYQFKLSKKWSLRPGVNWMFSKYTHQFVWLPVDTEKISSKSPEGTVNAQNIEYFTHIIYRLDSFTNIHIVPELNQSIEERAFKTDSTYFYTFNQKFFIPYMFIRSSKKHKYNFNFNFRAKLRRPQVNQILPVIDNSNPYSTTIGNISLQNYINYSNNINYRKIFGIGKSLAFSSWNNFNYKPIVNSNIITEDNYSISKVLNFKNAYSTYNSIEFTHPIKPIEADLAFELSYNFGNSYFIRNDNELLITDQSYSAELNLQFNNFDLLSLELDYSISQNFGAIDGIQNNSYVDQILEAEFVFTPWDRLEWSTDLYWEFYSKNSAAGAASIPILSSELSIYFDKKQNWSVGIRAFDILDKNQDLWRWWSTNKFIQNQSNAVQRYVMGTLVYKIRPGTKE